MMLAKHLFFAVVVTLVTSPLTRAQEDTKTDPIPPIIKVIPLNHAKVDSVIGSLRKLSVPVAVSGTVSNKVLLRGVESNVEEVVDLIRKHLDVPSTLAQADRAITEFIPLGLTPTQSLMPALQAVVTNPFSQLAIDHANRLLVAKASPTEVAAIRGLLKQVNRPARSLMINFFFLQADISGAKESKASLPPALTPIAKTLVENGFGSLELMAPVTLMVDEGLKFSSESTLFVPMTETEPPQTLTFQATGIARMQGGDDTVQLSIGAIVRGDYAKVKVHFAVETTIATELGDYVILAASPSSTVRGNALALVARVTATNDR